MADLDRGVRRLGIGYLASAVFMALCAVVVFVVACLRGFDALRVFVVCFLLVQACIHLSLWRRVRRRTIWH